MKPIGRVFVDQLTGKCTALVKNDVEGIKDMSLIYIDDKVDQSGADERLPTLPKSCPQQTIAASSEQVGVVFSSNVTGEFKSHACLYKQLPVGTKLYTTNQPVQASVLVEDDGLDSRDYREEQYTSEEIAEIRKSSEQAKALTDARIRGIAVCDGGGYQEMKEDDPDYTNWSFSDEGLQKFARALLASQKSEASEFVLKSGVYND
jgi:hypothetical protein